MPWSYVTIDRQEPVAIVRFDRKENLNAFNQPLVRELTETARTFHVDLETHYVVLAGAAEAFSAGADLKDAASWQRADETDVQRRHRFYAGVRLCKAWEELPQITIAAMERMAVGAGVAIALACDWRVLGRGAFLYIPEVKIGLNLQWGALPRLVTLVGPARAKRITLMGEKMESATALAWGLVDELAEDGLTVEAVLVGLGRQRLPGVRGHGQLFADIRRRGHRQRRLGDAHQTHRALPRAHGPRHVHPVDPGASEQGARLKARPQVASKMPDRTFHLISLEPCERHGNLRDGSAAVAAPTEPCLVAG